MIHFMSAVIHFMSAMIHFMSAVIHFMSAMIHFVSAMIHFMSAMIHFMSAMIHFVSAMIHFMSAVIHFMSAMIHFVAAAIHFMAAMIHFMAAMIHFMAVVIHFVAALIPPAYKMETAELSDNNPCEVFKQERNMKKYLALVLAVAALTACDNGADAPREELARVRIGVDTRGVNTRSVLPTAPALEDVERFALHGTASGGEESWLADFVYRDGGFYDNNDKPAVVYLRPGNWRFTLYAYQGEDAALKGTATATITAGFNGTVNFTLSPYSEEGGTGSVSICLDLPEGSGVASVETTIDGAPLDSALAVAEGAVVYENDETPVGQYLFSFVLKDAAGKTILVVSDMVVVTSGAKSAKEYALTDADFNGPPAAPSAFTVASYNAENQTLQFTWQDNSFNETGFILSDGTTTHDIAAATQSFDFPVSDPTASVVYTLKAVNSFGDSAPAHISGPIVFTITFDVDSGDVEAQTLQANAGASFSAGMPTNPTRTNYVFGGWYTAKNGGGSAFTADTPVIRNLTVYAKWINLYTVTFDAEGGSPATQTRTVIHGGTLGTNTPSAPTKTGYTFEGWYTAKNGGGSAFIADTIITSGLTVYAKWAVTQYTVTLDADGGSPATQTRTVIHGGTLGTNTPSAPTRAGYTFEGWYTAKNGGGSVFTADTTVTGNITVYAKWLEGVRYELTQDPSNDNYICNANDLLPSGFAVAMGEQITISFAIKTDTAMMGFYVGIGDWNNSAYYADGEDGWIASGWRSTTSVAADGQFHAYTWTLTANADAPVGGEQLVFRFVMKSVSKEKVVAYVKDVSVSKSPSVFSNLSLTESLAWIKENAEEGGDYIIILKKGESIAPQTLSYSDKNVSITLNGSTVERIVSLSATGSLFTIDNGVTLTLRNNVTLRGLSSNTASLVRVNSGGNLVLKDGAKISGNSASGSGGGVRVNGGTFTMSGGEISGNTASASDNGGGVAVYDGTFTMSGGTVNGNTAFGGGGGVAVYGGTFTMSGGTVNSNTSSYNGGGVVVGGGTFTMSNNGTISGNTANTGGGVYVRDSGIFTMDGGAISGNSISGNDGGGVYVINNSAFFMNAGNISNNTAKYGGGVYIEGNSTFTMSGGTVNGNTATYFSGGGVFLAVGTFTMSGGAISGNSISGKDDNGNNFGGGGVCTRRVYDERRRNQWQFRRPRRRGVYGQQWYVYHEPRLEDQR
jgi:uncharacterized repeat protein (TIGR02543 family)